MLSSPEMSRHIPAKTLSACLSCVYDYAGLTIGKEKTTRKRKRVV